MIHRTDSHLPSDSIGDKHTDGVEAGAPRSSASEVFNASEMLIAG